MAESVSSWGFLSVLGQLAEAMCVHAHGLDSSILEC